MALLCVLLMTPVNRCKQFKLLVSSAALLVISTVNEFEFLSSQALSLADCMKSSSGQSETEIQGGKLQAAVPNKSEKFNNAQDRKCTNHRLCFSTTALL